jgi:IS30 family transposase
MRGQRLTDGEKQRLVELVTANTPFWQICELIGRDRWTTRRNINYLKRPLAIERRRSPLRLSLAEREEISRGLAAGESLRSIARRLGRAPSTVSREVAANQGTRGYRACAADRAALRRVRRPKPAKLAMCGSGRVASCAADIADADAGLGMVHRCVQGSTGSTSWSTTRGCIPPRRSPR